MGKSHMKRSPEAGIRPKEWGLTSGFPSRKKGEKRTFGGKIKLQLRVTRSFEGKLLDASKLLPKGSSFTEGLGWQFLPASCTSCWSLKDKKPQTAGN